jgi:hypothetical protein
MRPERKIYKEWNLLDHPFHKIKENELAIIEQFNIVPRFL